MAKQKQHDKKDDKADKKPEKKPDRKPAPKQEKKPKPAKDKKAGAAPREHAGVGLPVPDARPPQPGRPSGAVEAVWHEDPARDPDAREDRAERRPVGGDQAAEAPRLGGGRARHHLRAAAGAEEGEEVDPELR